MAKLGGKLKGMDFKKLGVEHGEKAVFGLIVLVVLGLIAGTRWSGYEKTPDQLASLAEKVKERIRTSVWPLEKKEEFPLVDYLQKSNQVMSPVELARYDYDIPFAWPLYRKEEPIKEPEWLPPEDLIAEASDFIMSVGLGLPGEDEEGTDPAEEMEEEPEPELDLNDRFAARQPGAGPAGLGSAGPMAGDLRRGAAALGVPGAEAAYDPASGSIDYDSAMGMMGAYGEGGYGTGPAAKGRGLRYVAVRGVVPLRKQLEKIAKAMNLQINEVESMNLVEYLDFTLERQRAVRGPDPWAGPWEQVDYTVGKDVLEEAADFDFDVVDPGVVEPVFTMPLPLRLAGYWGDTANHPRLKDFTLSREEAEKEAEAQAKLLEAWEKLQREQGPEPVKKGGFADVQRNMGRIRGDVFGAAMSGNNEYAGAMQSYNESYGYDMGPRARNMLAPELEERVSAAGRLLLFRYFDFDVEPGYAYRYRVKLSVRNPSFGLPPEAVVDPSVAENQTRETPYSTPTEPVVVKKDSQYFLADIERDPQKEWDQAAALDDRTRANIRKSRPIARVNIYQWDPEVGTMIADAIDLRNFGQFVGEKRKSTRLDVAARTMDLQEVSFTTTDVFVDAVDRPDVKPEEHPDLGLPKGGPGAVDLLVVVNRFGELQALDSVSRQRERKSAEDRVKAERKAHESFKDKPTEMAAGSELDSLSEQYYQTIMMQEAGAAGGGKPKGGRRPNPSRIRGGGRSSSPAMP